LLFAIVADVFSGPVCRMKGDFKSFASPLGATVLDDRISFSVFSLQARAVEVLFFNRADDSKASRAICFDPGSDRTYHYWHLFVPGVRAGQLYLPAPTQSPSLTAHR
jgi:pullulanase/glycogen debranching enzyme